MTATLTPVTGGPGLTDPTQARRDQWSRRQSIAARIATHAALWVGALLSVLPFYWLVVMSTNSTADIYGYPPKLLAGDQFLENITNLVANVDLFRALLNSAFIALTTSVLVMFFDSLAAFAFAMYRFPGSKVLFVILLLTFVVPGQLSLVPSFVLMSELGWVGQYKALIVPGAANAFGIFLLRQIAQASIPEELVESATVDGAGFFRTWWHIGVPMMRGGLAFLGIFTFINAWNDYVWPLVVMVDPLKQPIQVALSQLNSVYGTDYGMVMAGALIAVVPLVGVFLIGSRHLIANIAAGALKG